MGVAGTSGKVASAEEVHSNRLFPMDLGLDSPEVLDAVRRSLEVIEDIEDRVGSLPADPALLGEPGSDLEAVLKSMPDPPVDIRLTIHAAALSSNDCLAQLKRFILERIPTSPIVLATLCRTALLASARLLFVVGPTDLESKRANAIRILLQESDSLRRCYRDASEFSQLAALVPPEEVLSSQRARHDALKSMTKGIRETEVLSEAAEIIADLLEGSGYEEPEAASIFSEHFSWTFNIYSGVAHGFGWPRLVPGTQSLPGDFSAELVLVTSVCQLAVSELQRAHKADK